MKNYNEINRNASEQLDLIMNLPHSVCLSYIPLKYLPLPRILYDNFEVKLTIHRATSDIFSSL